MKFPVVISSIIGIGTILGGAATVILWADAQADDIKANERRSMENTISILEKDITALIIRASQLTGEALVIEREDVNKRKRELEAKRDSLRRELEK